MLCHPFLASLTIYVSRWLNPCLPAPTQVRFSTLEITKVPLFMVFPSLPRWGLPPSQLPKYRYLPCPPPCPGGVSRPRNYQSIAIYWVPILAQLLLLVVKKMAACQRIIHNMCDPAPARVGYSHPRRCQVICPTFNYVSVDAGIIRTVAQKS